MFEPIEAIKEFVRGPSVSTDPDYSEGMKRSRQFVAGLLRGLGLGVETVDTPLHPILLASRAGPPDWPHVVIYGHYDVQPPDPLENWTSPPFEPEVRGDRLYGRGAADNKGPLLAHVCAVGRLLEKFPDLPLRITFLIEGEEEIGSPSFCNFLRKYKDRLEADFVLLSDTGSVSTEQLVITTGLRGIVCLVLEAKGPRVDLHSGIHGGVVLNPIQAVAELCASLHDSEGRVNIPGFYDDVIDPSEWEREELAKIELNKDDYAGFLGVSEFHTERGMDPFEAIRFRPTLEFNGIGGGYSGEGVKTVIPSSAFVKISCRLVPNQDPFRIRDLLVNCLKERCSPKVTLEIAEGHCGASYLVVPPGRNNTPADQSPILAKAFTAAEESITKRVGTKPLYLREGGSVPIIADLKSVVGLDSIMIGLCTQEDNLHSPNESIHLGMFENGSSVSEAILGRVAGVS